MPVLLRQNLRDAYTERSREYIRTRLRSDRPLPTRYFLERAALYQSLEYKSNAEEQFNSKTHSGLVLSPDPEFLHASVCAWIRDNSLEWANDIFLKMGIYEHQDIVNIACALRSASFREELQCAVDTNARDWLSLETALMRYARPLKFPFVKSSKARLISGQRHEYLFDAAQSDARLTEAEAEARNRHQRREEWVKSIMNGRADTSEPEVKTEVKTEVKMEDGITVKEEQGEGTA